MSNAQEKHSTAIHSQDQPEESKQSEVSSPLFSADVPVLDWKDLGVFLNQVKKISKELKEANNFLHGTVFEQKDKDPTWQLLFLKFNFHQNTAVAKHLETLRDSLSEVQGTSYVIQGLNLFKGVKFGSCLETLKQFQQVKISDQVTELAAKYVTKEQPIVDKELKAFKASLEAP